MELYSQILDHAGPSYGSILRHIRDRPEDGCLFHCTAGKDRTGLIAAIILKVCLSSGISISIKLNERHQLAGVDDANIAKDYALTRIGREPARAKIMTRLAKEPLFASNNQAALNMFTCR
jgi:protein tyrosine/serine phosphatase